MGHSISLLWGLSVNELARILRCSLKTAHRYKSGQSVPRYCELAVLQRDLGVFSEYWAGWTVNGEDLVSPEGWCVNRNDALIVPLKDGQISALRSQVRDLKQALDDTFEDQPEPGELPEILSTG